MAKKVTKTSKKKITRSTSRATSGHGLDYDFVIIAGGGFILIILIMMVIGR